MSQIPPIKNFTGDNEISFSQWLLRFEVQLGAVAINPDQNRQMFSSFLEESGFSFARDWY